MNPQVFKLITGEELIADVQSTDASGEYVIANALSLLMQQKADGSVGIGVFPWGNHVDGTITLEDKHIIYVGDPVSQLVDIYNKAFSTIAVPQKSLITG